MFDKNGDVYDQSRKQIFFSHLIITYNNWTLDLQNLKANNNHRNSIHLGLNACSFIEVICIYLRILVSNTICMSEVVSVSRYTASTIKSN